MKITKLLSIIFTIIAAFIATFSAFVFLAQTNIPAPKKVFPEGAYYINYYLKRTDFIFTSDDAYIYIAKQSGEKVQLLKDMDAKSFFNNWTTYEQKLYPELECNYVRISIPYQQTLLNQGDIKYSCVNNISQDEFSDLNSNNV